MGNVQKKIRKKIKEESHLNCTTVTKYAFCFLVCFFSSDKLAKRT